MSRLNRWLYSFSRYQDVGSFAAQTIILIACVAISQLAALFYFSIYGTHVFPFIASMAFSALYGLLLFSLLKTQRTTVICYLTAIVYGANIYFSTLYGIPEGQTPHILWFCLLPVILVAQPSLITLILGIFSACYLTFEIQCRIESISGLEACATFYRNSPGQSMIIAVVVLFSIGIVITLKLLIHLYQRNYAQATTDHLTGQYNRYILEKDLQIHFQRFKNHNQDFQIIFSDLDRFKEVNDLFGHDIGDQILRKLGQRLKAFGTKFNHNEEESINIYRFGGDEFLFLVTPALEGEKIRKLMQKISQMITAPFQLESYQIDIGVSLGLAYSYENATSPEELINFADIAMYAEKRIDRQNFRPKDNNTNSIHSWQKKFTIYKGIQEALNKQHFRVIYQPIYQTQSKRIKGCEALLRWNSSFAGNISPDEFIPVAEATGLIQDLTYWVISQSLNQAKPWFEQQPGFILSINISPYLLRYNDFIARLKGLLEHQPFLSNIEFEITETATISNSYFIADTLQTINDMGIRLSLDDYGQGSTSFLDLKTAPFKVIKLDKGLLWEAMKLPDDNNILEGAIKSAHSIGLEVTVEGIETQQHYNLVKKLGCDACQGYLFSKPIEASEIQGLLNQVAT